jgi:carboxyl-terminal processing protease
MAKRRSAFEIGLIAVLGLAVVGSTVAISQRTGEYAFFDELVEVKSLISRRFAHEPNADQLRVGAIRGMVEALDDPYTVYVPAAEAQSFNKDLTGEYVGIGAQVDKRDGWLTIVSPMEDSPALRAGIMANDRILSIDGTSTRDLTADECVDLLLGEAGKPVTLRIERDGSEFDKVVTRDRIKSRAVKGVHRDPVNPEAWSYWLDPQARIGYIRLTQFTPGCAEEVAAALDALGARAGTLNGLILDVRYNPGGLLSEATAIADLFLREGVIVSTRGRAVREEVARAREPGTFPALPIAILINEQAASASEVLAGALVENNAAIAVGTRTFGKGSVQSLIPIPGGNGSELKITEQGYYLPTGRSIQRRDDSAVWGVDPTEGFYVPLTDAQVAELFEVRRNEEILRASTAAENGTTPATTPATPAATPQRWDDVEWTLAHLKDPQLTAAARAVAARITSGQWQPVSDAAMPVAERARIAELARTRELMERLEREMIRTERRIAALEDGRDPAAAARDLIPDNASIEGGSLIIRDKDGNTVSTLRIIRGDLERWLTDAGLEPALTPDTPPAPTTP